LQRGFVVVFCRLCLSGNSISPDRLYYLQHTGWESLHSLLLTLTAVAALTGSANAADLAAHPYTKAPPPIAPTYSWTGFYVFGGGGGGLWAADQSVQVTGSNIPLTINQRQGGSGWFGTVGAGYDWQFNHSWVFGILADGQFGSWRLVCGLATSWPRMFCPM
jgi:hypothetical protein